MNESAGYDALVVGGGPAGATAAAVLAQKGRKVLVLEKDRFPRYHIGESLIPFCYFPLERIGMIEKIKAAGFVEKHSVQFVGVDGEVSRPFYFDEHMDHEATVTWQVERDRFDRMMLDNAREKGARVMEGIRVKNTITEDGKTVGVRAVDEEGRERSFHAPVTIDCSGRDGLMMSRNRWRIAEPGLKKNAVWTYFKGAFRDSGRDEGATTIAYIAAKGWFWYIPLTNDMVSVGVVADKEYLFGESKDPKTVLWREIENQPWVRRRVRAGVPCGEVLATGDYSYRARYCARDGVVLAGDALSFLDPVFSTGVFLALMSGELAAETVDRCLDLGDLSAARFEDYSQTFRTGVEVMRKFVYAFYDQNFNFKDIITKYPHLRGDLTDCLIGNVFKDLEELFRAIGEFARVPEPLPYGKPLLLDAAG